jgi:hypothetical protein
MACCGRAARRDQQATSLQVAAQQEAERAAQRAADDLAATVRVAAETALSAFPSAEPVSDTGDVKPRRRRVRKADDE